MPPRRSPAASVIAKHKRIIASDLRGRAALEEAQAANARSLANHVDEAKDAGVAHHEIADWVGLTRDGLTKFVNRHRGAS